MSKISKKLNLFKANNSKLNIILYIILTYFVYHIISGERGVLSYIRLSSSLKEKKEVLHKLKKERASLEKKVSLMSGKNIDKDMLDELAKANLGLKEKNEEVWIIDKDEEK